MLFSFIVKLSYYQPNVAGSRVHGRAYLEAYNPRVGQNPAPNLRVRLRRLIVASVLTIAGAAAFAFLVDYAIFKLRVAENWHAYGSVVADHSDAIPQKSGKTQLIFDPPQPQTCVHALFPHEGYLTCWYLSRHSEQRTNF